MQGTVASFDLGTRSGHVLTDDGVRLDFAASSLADHVRHLRVGQRVFVDLVRDAEPPTVTSIALWR
ncbi:cold-shock protein [Aeromicrobium fastidiosum]|uniref:Cold-shock protein n=1 Tax=Aeromicrobium fastidiosum TaxID=52699 RepID=A0A641AP40_9ACTN|nr:cold-shock protein [Aeromicrobium fastidiosum]KAA1378501.1 cold-shock protein [Aeromicrobium fastidiosum]MBP2392534.1 2-phospho-L-lactate guanylyltransferase [Aeromicrobium fastidiosum]